MEVLFDEFEPVSLEIWKSQVEKELKRSFESIKINDEIEFSISENSKIQEISKNEIGWRISQSLSNNSLFILNSKILTALSDGVSVLHINIDSLLSNSDFEIVFKDVLLDLIFVRFTLSEKLKSDAFISKFQEYCTNKGLKNTQINFSVNSNLLKETENHSLKNILQVFLEIKEKINGTIADKLSEILISASKTYSLGNQKILFVLNAEKNFYLNIAKIKTLKILWQKITEAYNPNIGKNSSLFLVEINSSQTNGYMQSIESTQMLISSVIGTADICEIENLKDEFNNQDYTEALTRNLHHILNLESFMSNVDDPAAGSHFVDSLTKQLMKDTWNRFLQNNE